MNHFMHLNDLPFNLIKSGKKTIECRLNDEKRKLLNKQDFIEFENIETKELITVQIENIYYFSDFKELYEKIDSKSIGYEDGEVASYKDMEKYYSMEEQQKYGVIAIEIKVIINQS